MTVARDFDDEARDFGGAAVRQALNSAKFPGPEFAPAANDVDPMKYSPSPFIYRDPTTIPRRRFLYGFELRRKQISAIVAPGAAGKTTLKVGRAIAMATGQDLLGRRVWNGPHRVWLWNLEDEMEEVEKTVHAFLLHWNLTPADLGDRLFIDGADHVQAAGLKLAVEHPMDGFRIQSPISAALIDAIKDRGIDYLDIDPFVSSHSVNENSNQAIDAVSKEWLRVARESDCAISLTHHVRKTQGEMSSQDARGAGAMVNAARSCLVLQRMSKETAEEFRIEECDRRKFFSVYDDKNNKTPPPASAEWFRFVGVGLGNGDESGPEDNIGACERWEAPNTFAGVTARQLYHIQQAIDRQPEKARKHSKSKDWVGKLVALILDRNLDESGADKIIAKMITTWLSTGALRTVERQGPDRHAVEFVEVGTWAEIE